MQKGDIWLRRFPKPLNQFSRNWILRTLSPRPPHMLNLI